MSTIKASIEASSCGVTPLKRSGGICACLVVGVGGIGVRASIRWLLAESRAVLDVAVVADLGFAGNDRLGGCLFLDDC